jgi:hypothetical protein
MPCALEKGLGGGTMIEGCQAQVMRQMSLSWPDLSLPYFQYIIEQKQARGERNRPLLAREQCSSYSHLDVKLCCGPNSRT